MSMPINIIVGVTGDISGGKTTFSRLLACDPRTTTYISADEIGHKALNIPHIKQKILEKFGSTDRKAIAKKAFSDRHYYEWLCNLLHPIIRKEIKYHIKNTKTPLVVVEIPLLFESKPQWWIDFTIYVESPLNLRAKWAKEKRGWEESDILKRERFLMPPEEKKKKADLILKNDTTIEKLQHKAEYLRDRFLGWSQACIVDLTTDTYKSALEISNILLSRKLAACVNIFPVKSSYRWKGKIYTEESEHLLEIKTIESKWKELIEAISDIHPYELPVITKRDINRLNWKALDWICTECGLFTKALENII